MDIVDKKGKKKVEKKKKEPVFFKGVEFIDFDDCDVPEIRLQCNSKDTNDDNAQNPKDMDVGDGSASSLQYLEPNNSPRAKPLQSSI